MKKTYVHYTRFWKTPNQCIDPDKEIKRLWGNFITFTPLGYSNSDDPRMIGIIECPDDIKQDVKDRFINNFSHYAMYEVDPTKIVEHLNEWFPAPTGTEPYFSLGEDGFSIIDNRPQDDLV